MPLNPCMVMKTLAHDQTSKRPTFHNCVQNDNLQHMTIVNSTNHKNNLDMIQISPLLILGHLHDEAQPKI